MTESGAARLDLVDVLRRAGCVAAEEEAAELRAWAASEDELTAMVAQRVRGEPLAWITGHARFCGLDVAVDVGVYVPRWQTTSLAERAATCLPETGTAVDLCTGTGAIAMVLAATRPRATVLATELDDAAAACARRNGVDVFVGDLFSPLPDSLVGRLDVVTTVPAYVPTDSIPLLPADSREHEPRVALDGGADGLDLARRVVRDAGRWLRPGGRLLIEVGTDQCDEVASMLELASYTEVDVLVDGDGDARSVCGRRGRTTDQGCAERS